MPDLKPHWLIVAAFSLLPLVSGCASSSDSKPVAPAAGTGGASNSGVSNKSGGSASALGGSGSANSSGGQPGLGNGANAGGSFNTSGGSGSTGLGGATAALTGGAANSGSGGVVNLGSGGGAPVPLAGSKNWVFLMLGQSNMEGQAPLEASDKVGPPRVFKIDQGKSWVPAAEPVAVWGNSALSPSRTFGLKVLEKVNDPEVNIYLINAAVGGTAIAQWDPQSGEHYMGMLPYLEAGMQLGTVRGFIWHQGESDTDTTSDEYAMRFKALVQAIRTKVGDANLPVVAGEIGTGGDNGAPGDGAVNEALAQVATTDTRMRVSLASGLSLIPGDVHYDTLSERLMGERFATAWWSILGN
ncbi:MAG: sialate O-acetylesterase [Polyangiaceae bacterium]|nr:sialate O-acetylesterase [Polyangiaceae bacterium]